MDAGDEELLGVRGGFLEKPSRLMRFDVVAIQFSSAYFPAFFYFFVTSSVLKMTARLDMMEP